MPKAAVNQIQIYYEIHGQGSPLVLIPGITADHTVWSGVVAPLAKKYQVILVDNRGAGLTDTPEEPYSIAQMAEDLSALLDFLKIKKASLLGHSMGGGIAQHLAATHPEKVEKLFLCASFAVFPKASQFEITQNLRLKEAGISRELILGGVIPWIFSSSFLQKNAHEKILKLMLESPYVQPLHAYRNQVDALNRQDTRGLLEKIKAKTLVIGGMEDIYTPHPYSEYLASHIAGAQLQMMKECGHMVPIECQEEFVASVLNF